MTISKEIKRLLLMNASSTVIFNYIGIFVNLYIWESGKSIQDVTWFNFVLYSSWTLHFIAGARMMARFSNRVLIRVVALSGAATFLLLTFLHLDNRMLWITIIAIPVGIMWGVYASVQNITLSIFGKGKDFSGYFSASSIIGQTISVVNPIVFALVIKWIGYTGSFVLMFLFVIILLAVSFLIPSISLSGEKVPMFKHLSFSKVFSTGSLKWMVPSLLAAGIFLQFQALFALLFTFSVSNDKLIIALLNVFYTGSAITAMLLYKKWALRDHVWLTGGMVLISAGFMVTLFHYAPLLVLSNILTTMGMFYFSTIWNTRQFAIISISTPVEQARIFIWRECLLNVSKMILLLLVLFLQVKDFKGIGFIALLFLSLFCTAAIPYLSKMGTDSFEKEKGAEAPLSVSV